MPKKSRKETTNRKCTKMIKVSQAAVEPKTWGLGGVTLNQLNYDSKLSKQILDKYIREKTKLMESKQKSQKIRKGRTCLEPRS